MDDIEKIRAFSAMEEVKDIPAFAQPLSLLVLCATDQTGCMGPLAEILSKHGVPVHEIVPCIMDIFEVFLVNDKESGKDVTG